MGVALMVRAHQSDWFCGDCKSGSHACFLCDSYGDCGANPAPDTASPPSFVLAAYPGTRKCSVATCGRYYHHACLRQHVRDGG